VIVGGRQPGNVAIPRGDARQQVGRQQTTLALDGVEDAFVRRILSVAA
jgi:hypothetical protein